MELARKGSFMNVMREETREAPIVNISNQDEVRAGETGHHVRYVLIFSCALVIVLFVAVAVFVRA
jgi:hypothetical protein